NLRRTEENLLAYVTRLDQLVKKENDPHRKELLAKLTQAQAAAQEADFDRALKLYEQVQGELNDPKLNEEIKQLKDGWELKGDKHRAARQYIYEVWPKLDPLKLQEQIQEARNAFEVCRSVGDTRTPLKLVLAASAHAAKLSEKAKSIDPDVNEDDR